MLIKRGTDQIPSSEITPEAAYLNRRQFIEQAGRGAAAFAAGAPLLAGMGSGPGGQQSDELTPYEDIINYNNFYEFGVDKEDPARYARDFQTNPWQVVVDGLCNKGGTYDLADLVAPFTPEERVYRLRCVEVWSTVVPWQWFPRRDLINRLEPTASARYVAFQTLHDPERMMGQRSRILDWPYREGL